MVSLQVFKLELKMDKKYHQE